MRQIPVYLVNRDLLSPLAGMVEYFARCEAAGPIIVVDCDSTYPPLLDWYARHAADLEIRRELNRGCRAAFQVDGPRGDFYLSSDADLDLSGVPLDCLVRLRDGMRAYGDRFGLAKTALSLRIDDLPEAGLLTERVRREQLACWRERVGPWFLADTDTTAALYRGNTGWGGYRSFRLGPPYSARHLAWYLDPAALPEEWSWYFGRINPDESLWGRTLNLLTRPQ